MKYYLIAGEASGDLHGSNLIRELRKLDSQAEIRCWGGDLMEAAGATVVKHYRDLAFMGFIEVVQNLKTILNNLTLCKKDIAAYEPDVLVLVDYPGFNLRIAKWAKEQGLTVIYYISPQVWAWKESRVKLIRKVVDKMLVILPFEEAFFNKWDYKVVYVGHPLVQVVTDFEMTPRQTIALQPSGVFPSMPGGDATKEIILLLPGSRKQEILVKLPIMLEASKNFPDFTFLIGQAPAQPYALYEKLIADYPNVRLAAPGQTYTLLSIAKAALVTSGTATLETALFGVPQVVCYKGSAISYHIAKRLLKIKYISLVNLIMDRPVVTELIQQELTPEKITEELKALLHDKERREKLKADYASLRSLLQQKGNASARAAQEIVGYLQAHP
ncbi:MAG TPA: lipid-A-disaccharide synthase [Flavisolibacter sp.]|jgi:lipid-A-disaccharide synthase|nr:lipid-A-disaccharide synthase [Flavisolibacter sp.]